VSNLVAPYFSYNRTIEPLIDVLDLTISVIPLEGPAFGLRFIQKG